ncbi:MAG: glycosyltransferase family 4 protein [Pseudomonadota bacterium]|nr:glycosyltransferase family 4 protein [Pseudomonadota bacterium]
MRITLCVDALGPSLGGIGRYTWQLYQGLTRNSEISLQCYDRNRIIRDPPALLRSKDPMPWWQRWNKIARWREIRSLSEGLVHGANYFLPPFAKKGVITVHDLSVFRYPETHPAERHKQFERKFHSSLSRATRIITDTATVRDELINDFGLPPERVDVVHLGVDDRFGAIDEATVQAALGPQLRAKQYGLCVSTLEPRKKIAELLAAWRRLPPPLRLRFPMVLAGSPGWLTESLHEQIREYSREGWLTYLGYVDEAALPALYAGAALFVYPSAYEGFGLPPLEAMASGTPTIVSSRSCLPEICGDAAGYIDPDNPDEFVEAIVKGLTDEIWQTEARRRGLDRASQFGWDRCVEDTLDVYRKAMSLN